jgi:predicted permease
MAVSVLQAGMAPMASVPILCQQYGLETDVANAALGAGLAISLFTVPFINTLLPM